MEEFNILTIVHKIDIIFIKIIYVSNRATLSL
mgnify:CR=1 FL=1